MLLESSNHYNRTRRQQTTTIKIDNIDTQFSAFRIKEIFIQGEGGQAQHKNAAGFNCDTRNMISSYIQQNNYTIWIFRVYFVYLIYINKKFSETNINVLEYMHHVPWTCLSILCVSTVILFPLTCYFIVLKQTLRSVPLFLRSRFHGRASPEKRKRSKLGHLISRPAIQMSSFTN